MITESFTRYEAGAQQWFTVMTIVDDPTYLTQPFITSTNFKCEPDGSKWNPTSCRAGT
jgi:hypothetical protein